MSCKVHLNLTMKCSTTTRQNTFLWIESFSCLLNRGEFFSDSVFSDRFQCSESVFMKIMCIGWAPWTRMQILSG